MAFCIAMSNVLILLIAHNRTTLKALRSPCCTMCSVHISLSHLPLHFLSLSHKLKQLKTPKSGFLDNKLLATGCCPGWDTLKKVIKACMLQKCSKPAFLSVMHLFSMRVALIHCSVYINTLDCINNMDDSATGVCFVFHRYYI